jgi:hypothetical protein
MKRFFIRPNQLHSFWMDERRLCLEKGSKVLNKKTLAGCCRTRGIETLQYWPRLHLERDTDSADDTDHKIHWTMLNWVEMYYEIELVPARWDHCRRHSRPPLKAKGYVQWHYMEDPVQNGRIGLLARHVRFVLAETENEDSGDGYRLCRILPPNDAKKAND